jgi:hypothetical protein
MPQPDIRDAHVDQLLTMLSHAYMNEAANYIADKIFPIVPVRKQSARIAKYTKADWFRDDASLRSPGTESAGSGFTVNTTDTYFCDNYAVHKDVADEVRENTDAPFDVDLEATMLVTDKLMLRREIKWAADFFATSKWANDSNQTATPWSDYGLGDPITNVETAKETVHKVTGREANTMAIGREVWTKLKHHPDFIERIKYTQRGVLTTEIVASILEIARLFVGKAIYNTYDEGQTASATGADMSYIMGDSCVVMHVADRPALLTASAGYTFHWANFGALSFIRRLRNDFGQFDRIEGHTYFDQKLMATDLGYFLYNLVA